MKQAKAALAPRTAPGPAAAAVPVPAVAVPFAAPMDTAGDGASTRAPGHADDNSERAPQQQSQQQQQQQQQQHQWKYDSKGRRIGGPARDSSPEPAAKARKARVHVCSPWLLLLLCVPPHHPISTD
jgi:hypothetical protein